MFVYCHLHSWIGGFILVGGNVNDAREKDNADDVKVVRPSVRWQ